MRLRLVPSNTKINFFGKSKLAIWASVIAVFISIIFYLINGCHFWYLKDGQCHLMNQKRP